MRPSSAKGAQPSCRAIEARRCHWAARGRCCQHCPRLCRVVVGKQLFVLCDRHDCGTEGVGFRGESLVIQLPQALLEDEKKIALGRTVLHVDGKSVDAVVEIDGALPFLLGERAQARQLRVRVDMGAKVLAEPREAVFHARAPVSVKTRPESGGRDRVGDALQKELDHELICPQSLDGMLLPEAGQRALKGVDVGVGRQRPRPEGSHVILHRFYDVIAQRDAMDLPLQILQCHVRWLAPRWASLLGHVLVCDGEEGDVCRVERWCIPSSSGPWSHRLLSISSRLLVATSDLRFGSCRPAAPVLMSPLATRLDYGSCRPAAPV